MSTIKVVPAIPEEALLIAQKIANIPDETFKAIAAVQASFPKDLAEKCVKLTSSLSFQNAIKVADQINNQLSQLNTFFEYNPQLVNIMHSDTFAVIQNQQKLYNSIYRLCSRTKTFTNLPELHFSERVGDYLHSVGTFRTIMSPLAVLEPSSDDLSNFDSAEGIELLINTIPEISIKDDRAEVPQALINSFSHLTDFFSKSKLSVINGFVRFSSHLDSAFVIQLTIEIVLSVIIALFDPSLNEISAHVAEIAHEANLQTIEMQKQTKLGEQQLAEIQKQTELEEQRLAEDQKQTKLLQQMTDNTSN